MQNQRKAFGVFFNTSVPVIMKFYSLCALKIYWSQGECRKCSHKLNVGRRARWWWCWTQPQRSAQPLSWTFSRTLGKITCKCSAAAVSKLQNKTNAFTSHPLISLGSSSQQGILFCWCICSAPSGVQLKLQLSLECTDKVQLMIILWSCFSLARQQHCSHC